MIISKVINNNLVKSYNEQDKEVLVMGCGLGFKKKPGDEIDESIIEKIYVQEDPTKTNKLAELLDQIPLKHIQVSNEIIAYAKTSLGKKLNDNIYLVLTDHIHYATQRYESGILIKNALLWEIKRFYNHEYRIGCEALKIIEDMLHVKLPEDEAGFIALHLVNASMDAAEMNETIEMTKLIQKITHIVRFHFQVELNENSLHYERFITHLKFFVQRVFNGTEIDDNDKNYLLLLKEQFRNEYLCVLKIKEYMLKECNKDLTEDEMIYLTIHIKRITSE